jgi:hypothetical protein
LDVYGLALGICRLLSPDDPLRGWFKGVLARLAREVGADPWAQLLCARSAGMVAVDWSPKLALGEELIEVLSLRRWLAIRRFSPTGVADKSNLCELDRSLLDRSLTGSVMPADIARAAVVHHAIRRAVHDRLESDMAATWLVGRAMADATALVSAVCRRFHVFARQMQVRHSGRQTIEFKDEYDVQDAIRALLWLHFDDVRPEEWTPSYGGKSTRMDFLLKREQVVVEVKMTRKGLDQKALIVQLTEDKERYRSHPDCRALVCFIYDPTGVCDNPSALESDLSVTDGEFRVSIVVAPKGI